MLRWSVDSRGVFERPACAGHVCHEYGRYCPGVRRTARSMKALEPRSDSIGTGALDYCFDAFSLREPVPTPLENALMCLVKPAQERLSAVRCAAGGGLLGVPFSAMMPPFMKPTRVETSRGEAHLVRDQHHGHAFARQGCGSRRAPRRPARDRAPRSLVEQHHARASWRARGRWRRAAAGRRRGGSDRRRPCRRGRPWRAAPRPRSSASARGMPLHRTRRLDDVLEHRHVREQIEMLEHHADAAREAARAAHRPAARTPLRRSTVCVPIALALLRHLEQVEAAQERRLAGAGRRRSG